MSKTTLIQGFKILGNERKTMVIAFRTEATFEQSEKIASEIQKVLNKENSENKYEVKAIEQ